MLFSFLPFQILTPWCVHPFRDLPKDPLFKPKGVILIVCFITCIDLYSLYFSTKTDFYLSWIVLFSNLISFPKKPYLLWPKGPNLGLFCIWLSCPWATSNLVHHRAPNEKHHPSPFLLNNVLLHISTIIVPSPAFGVFQRTVIASVNLHPLCSSPRS